MEQKLQWRRLSGLNGGQPMLVSKREIELLGQLKLAYDSDNKELQTKIAKELRQEIRGRI